MMNFFTQDDPELKKFYLYQSFAKKIALLDVRIGKIIVKGTGYAIYTFCTFPYQKMTYHWARVLYM